jgi:hypothetical protein
MRPSHPFLLAVALFATACGEGALTPEEQAEYGDLGEAEQALPIGGFGGPVANELEGDTPNEVPVCPDCYIRVYTSGAYVSSFTPYLMTIRDRLPSGAAASFDKLEIRSGSTTIAQFDLNGFSASHWLSSQGRFFWAYNTSATSMPTSQRSPAHWGSTYKARVRLRYTTAAGYPADLYFPVGVQRYLDGGWQVMQP